MSLNWVMLSDDEGFVRLPNEQILYTSPPRTSIALQSMNKFPGREPFSVSSSTGLLYLTNRRVIYIPSPSTPAFQSFAAPITNLHDTHVTAPWVGPNAWVAAVQPVPSGGIPSHLPAIEARITFKDGGAYEFHDRFCKVKERLAQFMEARALSGGGSGGGRGDVADDVHLEQLPAYEAIGRPDTAVPPPVPEANTRPLVDLTTPPQIYAPRPTNPQLSPVASGTDTASPPAVPTASHPGLSEAQAPPSTATPTPDEPPPGYEEAQRGSVVDELESSLRRRTARGGGGSDAE